MLRAYGTMRGKRREADAALKRDTLPNCITRLRIVGAVCLLFTEAGSPAFFGAYTLCGISDILDGWLARRLNAVTERGARLDSIADLCFCAAALAKLFPVLWALLPAAVWFGAAGVLAVRLISYGVAAVKYRRFASLHTWLNKLTGAALFSIPYGLLTPWSVPLCAAACGIVGLAALEELLIHLRRRSCDADVKTIFQAF